MLSNLVKFEHKVGDRAFHLLADANSPTGEVKEALYKFLGIVSEIERVAAEQAKAKEEEVKPE